MLHEAVQGLLNIPDVGLCVLMLLFDFHSVGSVEKWAIGSRECFDGTVDDLGCLGGDFGAKGCDLFIEMALAFHDVCKLLVRPLLAGGYSFRDQFLYGFCVDAVGSCLFVAAGIIPIAAISDRTCGDAAVTLLGIV